VTSAVLNAMTIIDIPFAIPHLKSTPTPTARVS
jgi:uncharacterized membrane protein YccF (DUF307 family)